MFLSPVTEDEPLNEIDKLNNKMSTGIHDIPTKILKACKHHIKSKLLKLINLSFTSGVFPDCIKEAKVIPLYRKNKRYIVGNYRPISILSCISKIIERLMHQQLSSFLSRYTILYQCQYGFREGYSTNLALVEIMDQVHKALNDGNYILGLYLDLPKDFTGMEFLAQLMNCFQVIYQIANSMFILMRSNQHNVKLN